LDKRFGLQTPRDLLEKLQWECEQAGLYRPRSTAERAYHAFNAAVTAWHICDWIWETASEQAKDKFRSISPEPKKDGVRPLQALVTAECRELAIVENSQLAQSISLSVSILTRPSIRSVCQASTSYIMKKLALFMRCKSKI
jgi:hypothetical protein